MFEKKNRVNTTRRPSSMIRRTFETARSCTKFADKLYPLQEIIRTKYDKKKKEKTRTRKWGFTFYKRVQYPLMSTDGINFKTCGGPPTQCDIYI